MKELKSFEFSASYPRSAVLFTEGEHPRGLFTLRSGRVKLIGSSRGGRTKILRVVEPGEVLGLSAVLLDLPYEVTAQTIAPSEVTFVKAADFLGAAERSPALAIAAARQMGQQCYSIHREMRASGLAHTAKEKLARLLLFWPALPREMEAGDRFLQVPLTHEEIGQLIGATRETVSRLFAELKRTEVVEVHGETITVRNASELRKLVSR